ncbi:Gfo/Idh/MocA family protein [Breznakiella homolactica]|uniref:Gfo/Idh/MocA family oxidoreductase n=1 Tax=Breznakiella homolactica TaxID=2798577 RepID=A0A7T7XPT2_9SPIR|nr:Gfo/Idh/MocA family oxidoreductase [Breznakiella homolactica]QQO10168.1 Gfo/Idh/MocA family oxidoreductase [Breznakiella homolactica]
MGKETLSAVIVGAGYMGKKHLECYGNIDSVNVTGIVDLSEEKGKALAGQGGCAWFKTLEDCFAQNKPDFVDVCLPSNLHRDAAVTALGQGCDVLVEKPFAVELEDIDAMIQAEKNSGRRLMVAHTCRFMPQYIYAKNAIESGKYGKLLAAGLCRESETPQWSWNNWLHNKKASGGTILDLSIHDIDLANWFLGTPVSFKAFETSSVKHPGSTHITSVLSYPSNAHANIVADHLMPTGYPLTASYRLVFEQAALEWNTVNCKPGCVFLCTAGEKTDIPVADLFGNASRDPYEVELSVFTGCLRSGDPFPISVEEARLAVYTVTELCRNMDAVTI